MYPRVSLAKSIQEKNINFASVYLQHKAGYRVPVSVRTIPIIENGEAYGAVEIFHVQQEHFDSLYNVEELKMLALTDQLTALPNRRYTESFLSSRINEFKTLEIQFGVLFMDIDHFKKLNDHYGHDIGDEVLRVLAKTFSGNLRSNDLIGRWGGEEFLGVCVCKDEEGLFQAAEKIRILTEKTAVPIGGETLSVTLSIRATLNRPGESADQMIRRADELLYISKTNGRNHVTIG